MGCPIDINLPDIDESQWDWRHWEPHHVAWAISGFFAVLACIFSFHLIFKHLRHYSRPDEQKRIVRIVMMVPIYAIDSWMSFRFFRESVYIDVIRDCYEAFVIYEFFSLLMCYLGGPLRAAVLFEDGSKDIKLPIPLCFMSARANASFLHILRALCLQYSFARVATTFISLALQATKVLCPGDLDPKYGYFWVSMINFVSVTVAMYALVLLYIVAKEDLVHANPVPKFLAIKFVIMLTFWQSLIVAGFIRFDKIKETTYWSTENIGTGVQNFLICFEMFLASLAHAKAFSWREYVQSGDDDNPPGSFLYWKRLFWNFLNVANMGDYINDAQVAFRIRKTHGNSFLYSPVDSAL